METEDERLARKEAFFNQLYSVNESDNGSEDINEAAMMLKTSHKLYSTAGPELLAQLCSSPRFTGVPELLSRLERTVSDPTPKPTTPHHGDITVVEETPVPSVLCINPNGLSQSFDSTSLVSIGIAKMAATKSARTSGKRKRAQSLELLPESQQIFRGLSFYFFPNNDIAPSRRFRIRKAVEWGALWVKRWSTRVTHIIVDNGLCYKDVLTFLKLTALPPDVILVHEGYPADCISFRFLLNPAQRQYQVEGYEEAVAEQIVPSVTSSIVSLPLKLDLARPVQTPSRTEGTDEAAATKHIEIASREYAKEEAMKSKQAALGERRMDDLERAIQETKEGQDLPFDTDEEELPPMTTDSFEDEAKEKSHKPPKRKKGSLNTSWQEKFSCMQKHDGAGKDANPNAQTIGVLLKMADYYDRTKDHWRFTAYRRAVSTLRKQSSKITTKEEAYAIPFVGERLAAKIEEIAWTNRLRRLDNTTLDPNDQVLQTFMKIYGVGFSQATTWTSQGYRTLDDLTSKAELTRNQKIGIDRYDDFQARVPRAEVELHGRLVRQAISKVDQNIQVTIGGSYRRGAVDSGDVDFIITKPNSSISTIHRLIIDTVIPRLFISNYLKVGLATTNRGDGSKWHGAACLPGSTTWRRIDFLLVPWNEMGAALIYFTGNDIFNRSIRLLASKKGMRLNQRGLWKDVITGPGRERITQGTLIEGKSEKRIFEVLGVPWRPPEHRLC